MNITKAELRALVEECLQEETSANEEKLYGTLEFESYTPEHEGEIIMELDRFKQISYNEIDYQISDGKVIVTIKSQKGEDATELKEFITLVGETIIGSLEVKAEDDYAETLTEDDEWDYNKEFTTDASYDIEMFIPKGQEVDEDVEMVNTVLEESVSTMKGITINVKGKQLTVTSPKETFYGFKGTPSKDQLTKNPGLIELDSATFDALKAI
jgi:hypothetical protein